MFNPRSPYGELAGKYDNRFGVTSGNVAMGVYGPLKPKTSFDVSSKIQTITPPKVNIAGNVSTFANKLENFATTNKPAIRAGAGLASELITANKLDDNVETQIVQNRPFVYKNRTGFLADKNRANFRNFLRSRTGMLVNANQAYAASLNADNQVAAMEGERQDKAVESYNNRDLQINATNTEAFNRNLYLNNMLKNNKTVQRGSAFTNYLSNLDTQDAQASALVRDKKALEIMGLGLTYGREDGLINVLKKLGVG